MSSTQPSPHKMLGYPCRPHPHLVETICIMSRAGLQVLQVGAGGGNWGQRADLVLPRLFPGQADDDA